MFLCFITTLCCLSRNSSSTTVVVVRIVDLPLEIQVKLPGVFLEGENERVGSDQTINADVRIIAATDIGVFTG